MSNYLSMCDYIDTKLDSMPRGSGVFVSLGSVMGANYALHDAFNISSLEGAVLPGLAGFLLAGGAVEKHVPPLLNTCRVGLTRGSMILRGSQLGAAFLPMALSLGLHFTVLAAPKEVENPPEAPVITHHHAGLD